MKKASTNLVICLLLVLTTGFYSGNTFASSTPASTTTANTTTATTTTATTPVTATPTLLTEDADEIDISANTSGLTLTSDTILYSSAGKAQVDLGTNSIMVHSDSEEPINITLRGNINIKGGTNEAAVINVDANVNLILEEDSETTITSKQVTGNAYGIRVFTNKTLNVSGDGKLNVDVEGGFVACGIGGSYISESASAETIEIDGGTFNVDVSGDNYVTGIGATSVIGSSNFNLIINDGNFDIDVSATHNFVAGIGIASGDSSATGANVQVIGGTLNIDVKGDSRIAGIGFGQAMCPSNIYIGCNSSHRNVVTAGSLQVKVATYGSTYAVGIGYGYLQSDVAHEIYLYKGDIQISVTNVQAGYASIGYGYLSFPPDISNYITVANNLKNHCKFNAGESIDKLGTEVTELPPEVLNGESSIFNNKAIVIAQTYITGIEITGVTEHNAYQSSTLQLSASIYPENAFFKNLKWASLNSAIATVNSTGLVTFTGEEGLVAFTATAQDGSKMSGTKVIIVINEAIEGTTGIKVASISLTGSGGNTYLYKAKGVNTLQLGATVLPTNATNKQVGYKSSSTGIATVSSSGLVSFKGKEGTVTITATAKDGSGIKATKKITVCKNVTAIKVPLTKIYVTKGKKVSLNAVLEDSTDKTKAISGKVTYTSSNKSSLSVDSKGNIKANKNEKKTVTVAIKAANGKNLKVNVYIVKKESKIKNVKVTAPAKLKVGGTYDLKVKPSGATATNLSVAFKSSSNSILSVTKSGKLVALKKGKAKITVTVSGKKVAKTVTVV